MIFANASGNTLFVSGSASDSSGRVSIVQILSSSLTVEDNDYPPTEVPIAGDTSAVQHINASEVTGAGVYVFSSYDGDSTLVGSDGDDYLYRYGGGDSKLRAGLGDDQMFGDEGDDFFWGGQGNDAINGGAGIDTLVMNGAYADYTIEEIAGQYVINHLGGTGFDGSDVFVNIEKVRFSDQTIELNTTPTDLLASITGLTLTVSGAAASAADRVNIEQIGDTITVEDSNSPATLVDVSGNQSVVRHIDASSVTGAGVRIFASYDGRSNLTGSRGDDYIYAHGDGDDILRGRTGDDRIFGNEGNDRLVGSFGDDEIDGGAGFDTAMYFAARSEFLIEETIDGIRVTHTGGTGASGIDELIDVEQLRFSDQTVLVDDLAFI